MRHKRIDTYEVFLKIMAALYGEPCDIISTYPKFFRSFLFPVYLSGGNPVCAKFKWFHNLCTISIGHTELMFTHASIDGCWPNRCSYNLNLSMDGKTTTAALALEPTDADKVNK